MLVAKARQLFYSFMNSTAASGSPSGNAVSCRYHWNQVLAQNQIAAAQIPTAAPLMPSMGGIPGVPGMAGHIVSSIGSLLF